VKAGLLRGVLLGVACACALASLTVQAQEPVNDTAVVDEVPDDGGAPAVAADAVAADAVAADAVAADAVADPVEANAADDDDGALADLQMGTFRVESASPRGKRIGVGVQVGYPTAVTAKLMLRPEHAVDVAFGAFSALSLTEPAIVAHADYLWHPLTLVRAPAFLLHSHVGVGGGVALLPVPGKKTTIPSALWYRGPTQLWTTARFPVGLDLALADVPVDIVLEAAPTVLLFPGLGIGCDLSLGARVWW